MKTKEHVFIGTDINRTAAAVVLPTTSASCNLANGEVIVCDKNKKLMTAGMTVTDTDGIYIGVVDTATSYTNPSGYTGYNIKWSPLISADKVKSYLGQAYATYVVPRKRIYAAASAIRTDYDTVLRIVYTDNLVANQTPAQFTQEWRVKAAGSTTTANWCRRMATTINADTNARVTASTATGSTGLRLVAKTRSGQTLNDIDDSNVVDFSTSVYVANGISGYSAATVTTVSEASYTPGHGNWQQVRDMEKKAKANEGVINQTTFPVPTAVTTWSTVINETYDCVTIKFDKTFISADMGYEKNTDEAVYIFIPNNRGNQMTDVLGILNDWMASVPGSFANVTL